MIWVVGFGEGVEGPGEDGGGSGCLSKVAQGKIEKTSHFLISAGDALVLTLKVS